MNETSPPERFARLRELGASTVGGALDALGVDGLILAPIRPVAPGMTIAGPAFTVECAVGPLGAFAPSEFRIESYIDAAPPGAVIVIAAGGAPVSTMGGVAALAARMRGVAGVVIDGGARDLEEIIESGFGAFIRHPSPASGKTRIRTVATGVPVTVGGVTIGAGDIVVGDSTGVVCFPADRLDDVLRLGEAADAFDRKLRANVLKGLGLGEAKKAARAG